MDIKEARKLATQKPEANYMTIQIDYSKYLVLPFKEAIKVMEALENAEILYDNKIRPISKDDDFFQATPIAAKHYQNHKMAQLLDVSYYDIAKLEAGTLSLEDARH